MNTKLTRLAIIAILLFTANTGYAQTPSWPEQTNLHRPGTRWWWLGSAVSNADIETLMADYSNTGIGTVEITPIYGVKGATNNRQFLGQAWMSALTKTQTEAEKNGMQVDMNMGTGWPFGGPMIGIKDAAGKLEYTQSYVTTTAEAPEITYDVTPKNANDELNCVMAFPNTIKDADGNNITKSIDTLEVTQFVTGNQLKWTPPAVGKWRIIAVFNGHTNQAVKRAAPGGEGLVMDHLSKTAVEKYIKYIEDAFTTYSQPYPTTFFNDSYEIFGADWSPRFFEEFEARRGYSLKFHLQELLNLTTDKNTQVRSDYRETMADMYLDNFIKPWNEFCHRHGVQTRNQSHGSPSNLLDTYASVDIPEIEGYGMTPLSIKGLRMDNGFTAKNSSDFPTLKLASSAAHVTGKPLTSSETFTWFTEHFRTSLSQMKPEMDLMFLAGVNRMFFHGTTYSPTKAAWPGNKFYASIDMSPTNSFWQDASQFMAYVRRCQSFLQMGKPDNDILVYLPVYKSWHDKGTTWLKLCAIDQFPSQYLAADRVVDSLDHYGYGSDFISDRMLLNLKYEGGKLVTEGGAAYSALHIPATEYIPASTQAMIDALREQGAKIIVKSYQAADILEAATPEPMRKQLGLRYIRRCNDTGHHYFISNLTSEDIAGYVPLNVSFQSAALFNPMDSTMCQALVNSEGKVYLHLRSGESVILQTYNYDIASAALPLDIDRSTLYAADVPLDQAWTLSFDEASLAGSATHTKTYPLDTPQTWESLDSETSQLMGTGSYQTTFSLTAEQIAEADNWSVVLGDVRESARVYLNDEYVGTAWSVPFQLDCTGRILPGTNTLTVEVTNLPANRIRQMDINGTVWRKFEDINMSVISASNGVGTTSDGKFTGWKLVPSGLNSPVSLRATSTHEMPLITAIQHTDSSLPAAAPVWYNLHGMRVQHPTTPGIYITGGRKVVIK